MYENDEPIAGGEYAAPARLTIRDALYVVFRHKWRILFTFLTVLVVGGLVVHLLPSVYQSEAKIQIKAGRAPLTGDERINMPFAETASTSEAAMRNAIQILQSPNVARQVVAKVGADVVLTKPDRDSALSRLFGQIQDRFSRPKGEGTLPPDVLEDQRRGAAMGRVIGRLGTSMQGNVLIVRYEAYDPRVARQVLQQTLDAFQLEQIAVNRPAIRPEFYEKEVEKAQTALAGKEKELEALRSKHKISSMDTQLSETARSIADINTGILNASSQISESEALIKAYLENLSKLSTNVAVNQPQGDNRLVMDLKSQLMQQRIRESDLAKRYPDGAFPLESVRSEIAITLKMLEEEQKNSVAVSYAANPARQQTEIALEVEKAKVAGLKASKTNLEGKLATAEAYLAELRTVESPVRALEREVSVLGTALRQTQENLERSRLAERLDDQGVSSVKVFQPATLWPEPVRPNRRRNYAAVFFAALFGSLGLAFALEYVSQTFKTPEDVERHLGLPALATISHEEFKSCI